jgi:CrcB protein
VLAAVAVGGTLGATGRWAISAAWTHEPGGWPWATLVVNMVGCVAIGVAARRLIRDTVAWAFVVTGILGGFTTFSAFAVELNDLLDVDRFGLAACYLALTLVGGYAATAVAERPRSTP